MRSIEDIKKRVLKYIQENKGITPTQISKDLHIPYYQLNNPILSQLEQEKKIKIERNETASYRFLEAI